MIYKNKGMYLEELINNTISYYNNNDVGLFEKRYLPIAIKEINKNKVTGFLKEKSSVDYLGLYQGKHIEFEAKQTQNDYFSFNVFKNHQLKYLVKANMMGAISFLIIHFFNNDITICISINNLIEIYNKFKTKKVPINSFVKYGSKINIVFPGILDIVSFLNSQIK